MQATIATTAATSTAIPAAIGGARRWTGRVLSGLGGLLLFLDAAIKVARLTPATEGTVQVGFPVEATPVLGAILLACLVVYVIPRTAVAGALLITGYLGGVLATHLRLGSGADSYITVFVLAALIWGGLALRDRRVMRLIGSAR